MRDTLPSSRYALLGMFVTGGLLAAVIGVFSIGRHGGLFASSFTLKAAFPSIGGVQEGTRIRVQGIDAGVVTRIGLPETPGAPVVLDLQLNTQFQGLIRQDAVAELATQGMIGARVVEIWPGTAASPAAENGETIQAEAPMELSELLAQAQQTIARLDRIASQVEQGKGSAGRFVMTEDAHKAAIEMMTSVDHLMTSLDETAIAARRSWFLKDYFINQGMAQPDDLLFRPGQKRETRPFRTADLFKPGTSVLSDAGKARLDEIALWLNEIKPSGSEVVVAAFDQSEPQSQRAQKLTQEQAGAVRTYLVDLHSVHKLGLFSRRSVVAAGFGNAKAGDEDAKTPPQRVEIVLYVPGQ